MDEPERPESYFRRLIWRHSGILCVVTLLTLPIILGVAIGYIIVLAVVTSYRKITGSKSREEKEDEAKKKIRIILGHDLLESAFTKPVKTHGYQNQGRVVPMSQYGSCNRHDHVSEDSEPEESAAEETEASCGTREIFNDVIEDEKIEKELGISNAAADRDTLRAASASSENYSTASEMEESANSANLENIPETTASPVTTTEKSLSEGEVAKTGVVQATPELDNPPERGDVITSASLGKLKYSVEFSTNTSELQVTILKAIHLPSLSDGSPPDTYVKICLLPQKFCWQRTKLVKESNPVYNETFIISGFSCDKMTSYTLLITVINVTTQWRGYYGDHVIGEVYVPLSHVMKQEREKTAYQWCELRPKIVEFPGLTKSGKINLSLCYRPISGRLIVTVKKARELKCESKEKMDPFVKLAIYCDGTRVGRGSTRVKRKVTHPVYNEKFNFDLTSDQIAYTTIVIKVLNNLDRVCLGATVIGYDSSGNGQEHWLCMMECLSQHVDAWHCIYA